MSQQVTISFSVVPQAKNKDVYSVVDKAIEVVQQSGVRYEVGAMETTLEGELDVLLDIIKTCTTSLCGCWSRRSDYFY